MDNNYNDQIRTIINGIKLDPNTKTVKINHHNFGSSKNLNQDDVQFVESLTNIIYEAFYTPGTAPDKDQQINKINIPTVDYYEFLTSLKSSNKGTTSIENGWKIVGNQGDGTLYVQKGNDMRSTYSGDYILESNFGSPAKEGAVLSLAVRKEYDGKDQGFYHVFGSKLAEGGSNIIRFYFNLIPKGAPILIELLSTHFNEFKVPFQFKCLKNPNEYLRSDSAVLYINKKYANYAMEVYNKYHSQISPLLKPGIPFFAKEIVPGIGFAENPPNGDSFGMSRSRIIAQAIFLAMEKSIPKTKWYEEVSNHFETQNLNINKIYLNANSTYHYNFLSK